MASRFKLIDRDTPMLLPPDLRDWVPEDDLVHFVIAAVARLPLAEFTVNEKGCGDEQYPPPMLLALLIYCYANGIFSSRRIERATYRDVGVRYLCGDTHPDHDTICAFRRKNLAAFSAAFVEVLELAREMRLLKLGCVSIDGTHIKASAAKDQNVTYERAQQLRAQLQLDVKALLEQAEQADGQNQDPQQLPDEIARREKLIQKMNDACAKLEERAKARADVERAEYERKVATREQRNGKGTAPKPPRETPGPDERINLTDIDAHLMRKSSAEGYTQSYNAQAVVDTDGSRLIVGQRVSTCSSDVNELVPSLQSIPATLGTPTAALGDCGYSNRNAFVALKVLQPALELYVSVHREDAHAERHYDYRPADKLQRPTRVVTDPVLVAMAEKLRTSEGRTRYRRRACTVEPVFGIIKQVLGFRQFLLRGLTKVAGEWTLVCLAYNLKRLHTLQKTSCTP